MKMNIATTLRYVNFKNGGPWDQRYYIMHDYQLMAAKYGVGLFAVMTEYDIDKICEHCDGLIIPGSGTNIDPKYYGRPPLPAEQMPVVDEYYLDAKLMEYFYKKGKPIFGVCGGHQELNVFFGGTMKPMDDPKSHDPGTHRHVIDIVENSFVYDVFGSTTAEVNCYHGWELDDIAPDIDVVATTKDGVAEAIESKKLKIYATQWHPEQSFHTGDPIENKFFENFLKRCEECK